MKHYFFLIICCLFFRSGWSQIDSFMRYADFHIHPTYKHYFRPQTADTMQMILRGVRIDPATNSIIVTDPAVKEMMKKINWVRYEHPVAGKTSNAIKRGNTSNLVNYDQSGYPEIMFVPGSILCNSYSPYEKQFALKRSKRWISAKIVTKMGLPRLETYGTNEHTPFSDFMAEYFYNYLQEEERLVNTASPAHLYKQGDEIKSIYHLAIKMVKDSVELDAIVKQNDTVYRNWKLGQPVPRIITPLVMSIEGAQVLYDTLSSRCAHILNPLNYTDTRNKYEEFFTSVDNATLARIHGELLSTAYKLKNLPHRLFFITLGHFAENHVVGFAKTLDRDPENVQHRLLSTLSSLPSARASLFKKEYAGFNPGLSIRDSTFVPDTIGLKVVEEFLDPSRSIHGKPTYIDVKHMDVAARIQYYYMRRKYEKKYNVPIPIVASHFGVSGETQAMACATGLWPNFDEYREVERTKQYYRKDILMNDDSKYRYKYWAELVMGGDLISNKYDSAYYWDPVLDPFDRAMYRSLDFRTDSIFNNTAYDPFDGFTVDENKVGWYYPWSINLFDEEIIEINKSDGIIGLLLDPRQLGAYMPKYRRIEKRYAEKFETVVASLTDEMLKPYGITMADINRNEYFKTEPLIRNLFYIVQIILQRQEQEAYHKKHGNRIEITRAKYKNYIDDDIEAKKGAWDLVSIGGDFDGLIDPIDYAPTASYIPTLRRRMIVYSYIFAQLHKDVFNTGTGSGLFITDLEDSHKKMHKFFYENGRKFIQQYF